MTSLDVRPASDVAKPSVLSRILTCNGDPWTRGGSTSGGDDGRERRCLLRAVRDRISYFTVQKRQDSVEAPVLWRKVAKYVLWRVERTWRSKGWERSCSEEREMTDSVV